MGKLALWWEPGMTRTQPLSGREGVSATQAVMCSNGASPK